MGCWGCSSSLWGPGACFCQVLGIGVLLLFQHWHPSCWPVCTSFPPYEQLLVAEVSGAVPIPIIVIVIIPLAVLLAPFSTGSGSFLAWCSPTSLLAANTRDSPCEQLLANVGVGAGSSIIIGVCCGHSSLVVVGPRSEGLGGGQWRGMGGRVRWCSPLLLTGGRSFIAVHSWSFVVVHLSLTIPVHSWSFVHPCQHLLTHPASSCLQWWW
jgi:hypothetical protein